MRDNEKFFNQYVRLAENVYHRLGACTECDDDFQDDSLYPELGVGTLLWNHFCDRYVDAHGTPEEHLSMPFLVDEYDADPEYAYAYMKQFERLLDKFHVYNKYPLDEYAR